MARTHIAQTVVGAMIAVASFTLGYYYRTFQAYDSTRHVSNVRVLRKYNDFDYLMGSDSGDTWLAKFCHNNMVDLNEGMTLDILVYEEWGVCKNIGGSPFGYRVRRNKATGKFINFNLVAEEKHDE